MEEKHFSVVFRPSETVREKVREMKQELGQHWNYGSKNAEAHLTILEFFAREDQLAVVEKFMKDFAATVRSEWYAFDGFGSFPERQTRENGVVYINPDEKSSETFERLAARFQEFFPLKGKVRAMPSGKPHMTIGRRLRQQRVDEALGLFEGRTASFSCECTLALRVKRINFPEQFSLVTEFAFTGANADFDGGQYSLFAG